jgi:hypothetical protein
MAWTIGSVTLPQAPERMSVQISANKQTEAKSGNYPDALVDGFTGSIALSGKLDGSWENNYDSILGVLESLVGTAVSCTLGSKITETFLLEDFKYDPENPAVTPYSIKLTRVSTVFALS